MAEPNASNRCVVLFSGGRDSSLAACFEARDGRAVRLFTGISGGTIPTDVVPYRVEEIKTAFPGCDIEWQTRRCSGIFRRIAFVDIEGDFARYKTNLILLGHQLSLQAEALSLCVESGCRRLVSGFSGYQADSFMEQTPIAIDIFRRFASEFDVDLVTPVYRYQDEDEVKYQLLDFGVTTKSLEAVSLFADTFSPARTDDVAAYLEQKLPIARGYIERRTGGRRLAAQTADEDRRTRQDATRLAN